jgi:hypothetical protein
MKNLFTLFISSYFTIAIALAQPSEVIRVKSGEKMQEKDKYLYDQFKTGTVYYRLGNAPTARLNYNLLLREMQFLTPAGDTMSLAEEQTIQQIKLNNEVFIYGQNKNLLKLLGTYGSASLAVEHSLKIANVDKEGGYGVSSGASSIRTYNSYPTGNGSTAKLEIKGDVVFSRQQIYYFVNQNNLAFPTSRKSLLKLFPKQKSAVEKYLADHSFQFNQEADLREVLEFCAGLQ